MSNPKITVLGENPPDFSPTALSSLPPWKRPSTTDDSDIVSRISNFLPQLQAANVQLEQDIANGRISEKQIENVEDNEEQYIEMNLGLGVLEEKRASKSRKRRKCGEGEVLETTKFLGVGEDFSESVADTDSSSSSGGNDEEEEEDDDDDDDDDGDDDDAEEDESGVEGDSSQLDSDEEEEIDDEGAKIDALLGILGTGSPHQELKRKRKRDEHKIVQRDILAALLNIDGLQESGGDGEKPVIEVMDKGD